MTQRQYEAKFIAQAGHNEANNPNVNQAPIRVSSERDMTRHVTNALKHGIAVEITNAEA